MTDTEKASLVLSIIGALSWTPIIIKAIIKKVDKTQLKIYPDDLLQIAENEYNVVLNIRIGIRTKIKEAFIENMTLDLEHSTGEKRSFKWAQLIETLSQTTINDNMMPTTKTMKAIGYNLMKDTYTEPFISFINPEFRDKYDKLMNQLRIKLFYITQNKLDKKQLEISEPFIEMRSTYKKYYDWPPGDYSGLITIFTSDKQKFMKSFSFHMDEPNSETFKELHIKMVIDKLVNTYIREENEKLTYEDLTLDPGLPIRITIL